MHAINKGPVLLPTEVGHVEVGTVLFAKRDHCEAKDDNSN